MIKWKTVDLIIIRIIKQCLGQFAKYVEFKMILCNRFIKLFRCGTTSLK